MASIHIWFSTDPVPLSAELVCGEGYRVREVLGGGQVDFQDVPEGLVCAVTFKGPTVAASPFVGLRQGDRVVCHIEGTVTVCEGVE